MADTCQFCGGAHSEPWEMGKAAEEYAARMTDDPEDRLVLSIAFLMGVGEYASHNPQPKGEIGNG